MISGSFGMQKKIAASFKDIFEADDCDDTDTILRCKRLVGNTQKPVNCIRWTETKTLLRLNNIEGLFKLRGVRQQAFQDGGIACDLNLSCLLTGHQGKQLEPLAGDRRLRICTVFARISQQYAVFTGDVELFVLICHVQIQSKVIVLCSIAIRIAI